MSVVYTFKEIIVAQKKPLDYKIEKAVEEIGQVFELSQSAVGVAFSGGKYGFVAPNKNLLSRCEVSCYFR